MAASFAIRVSIYFGAIFGNLGIYLPFIPIWLSWRGMSPIEIGIITSAPLFIRIIATPLIGVWSDSHGNHRLTIIIAGWLGLASAAILPFASWVWSILILVVLFQIATQSIIPIVEAKALAGARAHGLDFGRMRLWGSVTFIAANVIGGLVIATYGSGSVTAMIILTVAVTAIAAHALPVSSVAPPQTEGQNKPQSMPQVVPDVAPVTGLSAIRQLLGQRWFLGVVLAGGLIQGAHAVFYAFGAIHWRAIGISDEWIGMLWALGVVSEIVLFTVSGRAIQRLGAAGLLILGGAAGVLRWSLMALDPPFWALFPLQGLHALTFGATHLGTLTMIQTGVHQSQGGTAQTLHAALASGVIMGLTTLSAGILFAWINADSYLVMAVVAAVGTAIAVLTRRWVVAAG